MRWCLLPLLAFCAERRFSEYDAARVRTQVAKALTTVTQVLSTERHPLIASDVPHLYNDKYLLAEFLTDAAVSASANALDFVGVTQQQMDQLYRWRDSSQTVSLAFETHRACTYNGNRTQQVLDSTKLTTTNGRNTTQQTFRSVTTHYWGVDQSWSLFFYRGTLASSTRNSSSSSSASPSRIIVDSRNASTQLESTTNQAPFQCGMYNSFSKSADMTWLFTQLNAVKKGKHFVIDRSVPDCHTPRRNKDIDAALNSFSVVQAWATNVASVLADFTTFTMADARVPTNFPIFVPILPIFEVDSKCDAASASPSSQASTGPKTSLAIKSDSCVPQVLLSPSDMSALLAEQQNQLRQAATEAGAAVGRRENASVTRSDAEARVFIFFSHLVPLATSYADGVDFIESMLRQQLIQAIGKEVTPADFGDFIRFNNNNLFAPEYKPLDFSFAVRRPEHDPEGIVAIEETVGSALPVPIRTIVRKDLATSFVNVTLSGGTVISLGGERYLHAALFYQFSEQTEAQRSLAARARQFSSFILMVGTMVAANEFDPSLALIVKDKDDVLIPLLFENIPTPKAFRDAIESLSPSQQAFAKAFRSMQLASTLFAVVIVEIKPQLEVLLRLPEDSLTKEIALTQDLMQLFIEYQIPSDLLSYKSESASDSTAQKVAYVKAQVAQMKNLIDAEKANEIKEKQQKDAMSRTMDQSVRSSIPLPSAVRPAITLSRDFVMSSAISEKSSSIVSPGRFSLPQNIPAPVPLPVPVPVTRVPMPVPVPVPQAPESQTQPQPQPEHQPRQSQEVSGTDVDYTAIPSLLDKEVERLDPENALSATIIKAQGNWRKSSQKGLLGTKTTTTLWNDDQVTERKKAMDLLEALSRSGVLAFTHCSLHVVIGSTQTFDETLINTVIQQNRNPIDSMERSSLIIASTVLGKPARDLVNPQQVPRLSSLAPNLFPDAIQSN